MSALDTNNRIHGRGTLRFAAIGAYMKIMARYGPRTAPMGQQDHPADHFARALG